MWTSGFFNSVNGDRVYNAEQMSNIFEGLITDGVYESVGDKLAVQQNNGMTIQIASGRGWFGKRWVNNDAPHLIELEASDVTLNRYAAVCVRVDTTDSGRTATPYIKYSDYATTPARPTMIRTETVKEYCLAYVYIKAGATAITASDIEDTRANTELCGWVTGLIEQLNSATLWTQWESLFNDWFKNLTDLINENTETMLVSALPVSLTLTLSADGWTATSGGYTQSVEVVGMTDTKSVFVQPVTASVSAYSKAETQCSAQTTNSLTFTAISQPTVDINVSVLHMGV